MDVFKTLRQQAADRRDKSIRIARLEYHHALRRIAELENQLSGALSGTILTPISTRKTVPTLVKEQFPRDRTFTVEEMTKLLLAAEPERRAARQSVRQAMYDLEAAGLIRRVCRQRGKLYWASADYRGPQYRPKTYREMAAEALHGAGALTTTEILVRMLATGFGEGDDPRKMKETLGSSLRRYPATFFQSEDGRWSLAQ